MHFFNDFAHSIAWLVLANKNLGNKVNAGIKPSKDNSFLLEIVFILLIFINLLLFINFKMPEIIYIIIV